MHFDGAAFGGDNPNLNFTIVHCDSGKKLNETIGIKVEPKPPPSYKPNQLVIKSIPNITEYPQIQCASSRNYSATVQNIALYEPTPYDGSSSTSVQTWLIRCYAPWAKYTLFEWDDSRAQWVVKESEGMVETPECTSVPMGDGDLALCTLGSGRALW